MRAALPESKAGFFADGQLRFTSRNQRDLTKRFPELQVIGKTIKAGTAILDGEIVALDRHGSQCFEQLQNHKSDCSIINFAFDLIFLDGLHVKAIPFMENFRVRESTDPLNVDASKASKTVTSVTDRTTSAEASLCASCVPTQPNWTTRRHPQVL